MTAPLQVIALRFSRDAGSEDRILAEVDRLRGRGVLRLLDMLFVAKSQDGTVERLTIGDDEDFGSLLTAFVPLANGDSARPALADGPAGFHPADARALADSLEPGTALAFLLVEHYWAAPLFDAIAETGGTLIGEGFLTSEAELVVGAEVAAMEEAAEVIALAQADEASALLVAAGARAEAAEAVADSQLIQSAAAADAVRALITAGLVEQAAAHEAVTALTEAGLIIAAADQAAADAVAEDAAAVAAADELAADAIAEDAVVVAAANQAAADAVAEDIATVEAADELAAYAVAEDVATVEAADEVAGESVAESLATIAAADEVAAESVADSLITIAAADEIGAEATSEAGARVRAASITMAEAQVLRYLSTPLPFSVIAGKLGISRSAAKERAARLYHRLGVHSREEAVSRARSLGLIGAK
jgi:DNA-binding CsgD family transcriptional regulator